MRRRTAFARITQIALGATVAYALVVGFRLGGARVSLWVDDVGLAVASAAAGAAALFLSRRRNDRTRRGWQLIAAASFLWSAGELAWSYYELIVGRDMPFPSWADAFYLGGTAVAIVAVIFLGKNGDGATGSLRRLLDGCILGASLLLVSWVTVLESVVRTSTDGRFALGVSLAYPIGDVVTLAVVLSIAGHARKRGRHAMLLLAAGMVLQAITDSVFVALAAHNSYTGGFVDTGWFLGYLLIGLAALRDVSATVEAEHPTVRARFANVMVPYGAAVASIGIRIVQEILGHNDAFLFWCGSVITVLVLGRLMLTIADNLSLARSLEHKVEQRTQELASRERLFRSLVQNSSDIVIVLNGDGVIVSVSSSVHTILGLDASTLIGEQLLELVHLDDIATAQAVLTQAKSRPRAAFSAAEFRVRSGDGRWRMLEATIANLLRDPDVAGIVLNARDVSERKALETELTRQALHDSLTGLANRALFRERINHALARRDRLEQPLAVLFLDLDGFKEVNDSFGHVVGDELLRQASKRLIESTRAGDTVARIGGDEFGILVESFDSAAVTTSLAERCIEALRRPFKVAGKEVFISVSIGIAITNAIEDTDEILRNADVAMYEVKSRGGGSFQLYDPLLHAALLERVELARDLRGAVERGELMLKFQPVYTLRDGALEGAEALVRWNHPTRGEIAPDHFIKIAEESGLIVPIGGWVLEHALLAVRRWQEMRPGLTMAVNLSARQLQERDLPGVVQRLLATTRADPSCVILEITESVLMQDTEETIERLHELKRLGINIAIDDFGTGYSSLSYLKRLPTDILKIDRSFTAGVDRGPEDSALTRAIVRLSSTFGLHTVAEGVETVEQAEALRAMGCEYGQGFLFAKPLPADDFEELVHAPAPDVAPIPSLNRPAV